MKKAFIFLGAFALVTAPFFALAAPAFAAIIPEDIATGGPYLQACDAVRVFDNLLRFTVSFAVIVATLMFTYAGFLYVTASANQNNLESAKKIFGNVFLGLLFILGAWLIISLVMSVFLPEKAAPWNQIECTGYAEVQAPTTGEASVATVGKGNATPDEITAESAARDGLCTATIVADVGGEAFCRLTVNKPSTCGAGQTYQSVEGGCTNVRGLESKTAAYAAQVALESKETQVITGGSELGHAGGDNPGSHGAGDKVDFRRSESLRTYIVQNVKDGTFTRVSKPTFGDAQYIDTRTGAVWTDEGDHYDVCVSNCAAPAARGS